MSTNVRWTSQQKQGRIGQDEVGLLFSQFGWVATRPSEDNGEDFIVDIYYEGKAFGINFYAQVKSITNLNSRRKGNQLPYPDFKVKDLLHWEQFALPVVLIIWDIQLHEGRWVLIDNVIKHLDQDYPNWRQQKTKTIYFPWENGTNDDGLKKLRETIGKSYYPNLPIGQSPGKVTFLSESRDRAKLNYDLTTGHDNHLLNAEMELLFPDNLVGISNQSKFQHSKQTGETVVLESIGTKIQLPDWYKSLFGDILLIHGDLEIGSRPNSQTRPVNISIIDNDGYTPPVQNVEFKLIAAGEQTATWSNEHQKAMPLSFLLVVSTSATSFRLTVDPVNKNVDLLAVRDALKFMKSFAKGGKLRLVLTGENDEIIVPLPADNTKKPGVYFEERINLLCEIQEKTEKLFQVNPYQGFTDSDDIETILELTSIIKTGKLVMRQQEWSEELKIEKLQAVLDAYRQTDRITIVAKFGNSSTDLLDKTIELGQGFEHITGKVNLSREKLEEKIKTLPSNQSLELGLFDVEIIQLFPDWFLHESKRLAQNIAKKFNVNTIYLFGSLAWGEILTPDTDIDLAVSGLKAEDLYKAVGYLESETDFPFDLIDLDEAPAALRERILREGELLYEREPVAVGR